MLQKVAHQSVNRGKKASNSEGISFKQMEQSYKKKNVFCYYFHIEYCGKKWKKNKAFRSYILIRDIPLAT